MENNEKRTISRVKRSLLLLISVLLITAISCRQDEILSDPLSDAEQQYKLKSSEISSNGGNYFGDYKGGLWQISLPEPYLWNNLETILGMPRIMVFYAHGMVDPYPYEEIKLLENIIDGIPVKDIITGMGMGYTTTSYRDNGLVVLDAIMDIQQLTIVVKKFFLDHPEYFPPDLLILGGPSEGGLVTVKTIEKYPQMFDGGISICGPIGSFYDQLQHNGDFHVLFNYFFGPELKQLGILHYNYPIDLGSPEGVDPVIMSAWKDKVPFDLQSLIIGIMANNLDKVTQLLNCVNATVDMTDPTAMVTAVIQFLRYNIMLTNDVMERMKGVPYTNIGKIYNGSENDDALNAGVERILHPSFNRAENFIRKYETSGKINVPLVIIHTTGDHITPFWHQEKYASKVYPSDSDLLCQIDVDVYGHCTISKANIVEAFACLAEKIGFSMPTVVSELSQQ